MKRKINLVVIIMIMLMLSVFSIGLFNINASATTIVHSGTCGTDLIWTLDDDGVLTISGTGEMDNYELGESPWFSHAGLIKTIKIENGVTNIGDFAFKELTSLTHVTVPNSVDSVGYAAFGECIALQSIYLSDSIKVIGGAAFTGCVELSNINIPNGVTSIDDYTFYYCLALSSVNIPNSVISIGEGAFKFCSALTSVYYCGTETQWKVISKESYSFAGVSASWIYCPNGHCWIKEICTESKVCSKCGYTDTSCIRQHNWINATCTTPKTCAECNLSEGNALGHNVGTGTFCKTCGIEFGVGADTEYSITYHLDGGTNALKNPDVYTCEDVIILKDATKIGYDFAGWFLDETKTEQISEIFNRTENLEVYAKFTPKSYTATFKDAVLLTVQVEGRSAKQCYVPYGSTIDPYSKEFMSEYASLPTYYTECSYFDSHFSGWYVGSKSGKKIATGDTFTMTSDMTIYCSFDLDNTGDIPYYYEEESMFDGQSTNTISIGDSAGSNIYVVAPTLSTGSFYVDIDIDTDGNSYGEVKVYNYTKEEIVILGYYKWDVVYGYQYCNTYKTLCHANPGDILVISWNGGVDRAVTFSDPQRPSATMISKKTSKKTVYYDKLVVVPSPTPREGYNFLGWYDAYGNKITGTWRYTEDQTFTANWQATQYSITYNLDGGTNSLSNPSFYTIEDTVTLSNPSKVGYTFKGWYSDSNFTNKVSTISKRTGNITLYAKYEVNSYNLTLDGNEGVFAPKLTFVSDGIETKKCYFYDTSSITAYRPTNKEGFIFAGWYLDEEFTQLFKFNGQIKDDTTLYAKWVECSNNIIDIETLDEFSVNIQGQTERLYAFVSLVDGQIKLTSDSDNLDLCGTLYDADKNALISADDISDNDLDFTFSYEVNAGQLYYIAVKGNRTSTKGEATIDVEWIGDCTIVGTTYPNRKISVVYDTYCKLPQKPIKEGYVFLGWFDEDNNQVVDGIWNFSTDKTLTAKWEEATYHTVIFKDENGEIIFTETYYLSEDIVAPELPTKEPDRIGSYYAKWDNNYTGVCTGDAIYTVVFEIKEYTDYTVIFKNWNGDIISERTYHYGDAVVIPTSPSKDADNTYIYTFKGWDSEVVACDGNATYTATYDQTYIDYTVIFKDENGVVLSTSTYHYGDTVSVPEAPTKTADNIYTYDFAGWDKEVTACEGNTTYIAVYNATFIDYTITFEDEDGSIISTDTYHYGENIVIPAAPVKASDNTYTYTFAGWDSDVVTCNGSKTYVATYTSIYIDYTVVFKNFDGEIISSKIYHYGDAITIPNSPTRESDVVGSYTFKAWDKIIVDCDGNATYTATYNVTYADYTVTFKNWNGEVISTKSYHYGDVVLLPAEPTREADEVYTYSFSGWDKEVIACVGDEVYTATYESTPLNYVVIFKDSESGKIYKEENLTYGSVIILPDIPTAQGKTFAKWNGYSEGMTVKEDVVFTVVWHLHNTVIENRIEATCLTDGSYERVIYCSVCNEELSREMVLINAKHDYGEPILCNYSCQDQDISVEFVCERCFDKVTIVPCVIDDNITCSFEGVQYALGQIQHNYDTVATAPTCESQGFTTHTCVCGKTYTDNYVEANGHTEIIDEAVAPSCTVGLTEGKHCSACGKVLVAQEEVAAVLGHDYKGVVTAPTCTEKGYTTYTCARCDDSYISDYVDKNGHSAGSVVVENNVEPNCTDKGSYDNVIYCTVCDVELSREKITINALGHTAGEAVVENRVEPTCTANGSYDSVVYCSVCGATISREYKTIAKLEHDKIVHTEKAPTCIEIGWNAYETCKHCDYTTYEEIPANGHHHTGVVIAPTCTEQGYTTYTCDCGDTYKTDYVNAFGHTEVIDNAVGPTCTETGLTEGRHCSVCNTILVAQQVVPANGHSYESKVTAPTCTEQGYATYTCHCGESYVLDYVNALGHTEVTDKEVAPTCTATGLTEGKHCSVCNEVLIAQEVVDELGHDYADVKSDETSHWKECTCGDQADKSVHTDKNGDGKCDICEYSMPIAEDPDNSSNSDSDGEEPVEQGCGSTLNIAPIGLILLGVGAIVFLTRKKGESQEE